MPIVHDPEFMLLVNGQLKTYLIYWKSDTLGVAGSTVKKTCYKELNTCISIMYNRAIQIHIQLGWILKPST